MKRSVVFSGVVALVSLLASAYLEFDRIGAADIKPRNVWKVGGSVFHLAFSPDGKWLIAGIGRIDQAREVGRTALGGTVSRFPCEIKLWEVTTGKEKFCIKGNPPSDGLRFSPDGKTFVSGGVVWNKTGDDYIAGAVKIWDSQTGKEKLSLDGHERRMTCAAFSPDGRILASGSFDGTLRLWNLADAKTVAVLEGHRNIIWCLAISPDGKMLASGGYNEVVRLWDVAKQKETATFEGKDAFTPGQGVFAVAFSADGKWLLAGVDGGVKVWDVAAKKLVYQLPGKRCNSLALSPDGTLLACQVSENEVKLSDLASGKEIARLKGHTDSIHSIAFSPDGKNLASGSSDRIIRSWDVAARKKDQ